MSSKSTMTSLLPLSEASGVDVVVLEDAEPKEFEQEFAQDVVALIASFSARLYGRRGGRKKKVEEE